MIKIKKNQQLVSLKTSVYFSNDAFFGLLFCLTDGSFMPLCLQANVSIVSEAKVILKVVIRRSKDLDF